jgi:peptidoglycan/LPS O-acetylase OafA/YrhL
MPGRNVTLWAMLAIVAVLVIVFVNMIASYWDYYDIGSSGANGLALIAVVTPIVALCFTGVTLGIRVFTRRRGIRGWRVLAISAGGLAIAFVALFLLEVWRTADYPTERPKSLAAFVGHYLGKE